MSEDEKYSEAWGWNSKGFSRAVLFSQQLFNILAEGIFSNKRFRVEIICDPDENEFRLLAAESAEGDTEEEFYKSFEWLGYPLVPRKTQECAAQKDDDANPETSH